MCALVVRLAKFSDALPLTAAVPAEAATAAATEVADAVFSACTERPRISSICAPLPTTASTFLFITSTAAERPRPTLPAVAPAEPAPVERVVTSFAVTETSPTSVIIGPASPSFSVLSPTYAFVFVVTLCAPAAPAPENLSSERAAAAPTEVRSWAESAFTVRLSAWEIDAPSWTPARVSPVYFCTSTAAPTPPAPETVSPPARPKSFALLFAVTEAAPSTGWPLSSVPLEIS